MSVDEAAGPGGAKLARAEAAGFFKVLGDTPEVGPRTERSLMPDPSWPTMKENQKNKDREIVTERERKREREREREERERERERGQDEGMDE